PRAAETARPAWDGRRATTTTAATSTSADTTMVTLRQGYSPTDARFNTAGWPTAPRRVCPARNMFSAAVWSRSAMNPQRGQTWVRTERRFSTRLPHDEQSCDV